MPRVTAVITTFNRAPLLAGAIRSVLAQTDGDLELLVMDNASTDATEAVVRGAADARVRYIRHPPATIARARNLALAEARGEFVAYLDDDDEWLPDKVACQRAAFAAVAPDVALVYGGFARIDAGGALVETHAPVLRGRVLEALLWQRDAFTGSASNPMLRASVVRALGGYNDEMTTSEDWELYLRLAEQHAVDYVPQVVVRIRTHRGPRLGDRVRDAAAVEQLVLGRYGPVMTPALRSYYLQKIGGKLCRTGDAREGRAYIRAAVRTNPRNVLAYAQYGLSFLGDGVYRRLHAWYKRVA